MGVDAVEPYSKVITAGGFIFVKSHIGYSPVTGEYPADVETQTRNTLDHLVNALTKADGRLEDSMRINVFLADIDRDFDGMDRSYLAYFAEHGLTELPARTTIGVPLSWPQLLVQMDLLAAE